MLRNAFAFISGVFASMIVVTFVELADATLLYPPPPGLDFKDPAQVDAFVAGMPASALAMVLAGWCLGAFVGGGVAARLAETHRVALAASIGALVAFGVAMNALQVHHPAWVVVGGLVLPVPLAWLAAQLVFRRASRAPAR
jgi:hypothetical protein